MISESLEELKKTYKDFDYYDYETKFEARNLINNLKKDNNNLKDWMHPKSNDIWHITTYYAAGINQHIREQNSAYKEFSEGKLFEIELEGFVYIPNNLIFAFTNNYKFYSNNEYPHLTLLINGYLKPKHSNCALKALYNLDKNMFDINKRKENVYYHTIEIENYTYGAYILFYKRVKIVKGSMTSFMS